MTYHLWTIWPAAKSATLVLSWLREMLFGRRIDQAMLSTVVCQFLSCPNITSLSFISSFFLSLFLSSGFYNFLCHLLLSFFFPSHIPVQCLVFLNHFCIAIAHLVCLGLYSYKKLIFLNSFCIVIISIDCFDHHTSNWYFNSQWQTLHITNLNIVKHCVWQEMWLPNIVDS